MSVSEIGHKMKSIYTWMWLSCCLGWLIFPAIVLFFKYFGLASTIRSQNDKALQEAGDKLLWSLILNLIPLGITNLIGVIFMYIFYSSMKDWAARKGRKLAAEGFGQLKTSFILNIIPLGITQLIGLILFLIGFPKAANGMM